MSTRLRFLDVPFESEPFDAVLDRIADRPAASSFAYVVTPNVDHVVRIHRSGPALLAVYEEAWSCLCDSRILQVLAGRMGLALPLVTGSGLVAALFRHVLKPGDAVTVIGCADAVIAGLRRLHPGVPVNHYAPPMGFIRSPAEVAKILAFVEAHPARFTFLAVGSPQQEILARRIEQSGRSRGLGICVGNALAFVANPRLRAPAWMRHLGMEWAYRLLTEPARLWRRYLVDDMYIFVLFARAWRQRLSKSVQSRDPAAAKQPID
jgi:exopolysaccharide biosynthesis WecB/TagA/CpsF family protein